MTFFRRPVLLQDDAIWEEFLTQHAEEFDDLFVPEKAKQRFFCDGYPVELDLQTEAVVEQTHFWFGLFSHSRERREWKGILRLDLSDPATDIVATEFIAQRRASCSAS